MRLNSFQVRPSGFTEHFPETGGNHDIPVFPADSPLRASELMQSPQDCSMTMAMKSSRPLKIVKSSSVFATPFVR